MTAQISDTVWLDGESFRLVGQPGYGLLSPHDFGMAPGMIDTGCYRGYYCSYRVEDDKLLLVEMTVGRVEGGWLPIDGHMPGRQSNGEATYEELDVQVRFTGEIRIATDFIQELYIHMGYQDETSFQKLIVLEFEEGVLVRKEDCSAMNARHRGSFHERYHSMAREVAIRESFLSEHPYEDSPSSTDDELVDSLQNDIREDKQHAWIDLALLAGDGVVSAKDALSQLAEEGYAEACYHLGLLWESGKGWEKDTSQATTYLKQGSMLGHAKSIHELVLLSRSSSQASDAREALDELVEQGGAEVLFALGKVLEDTGDVALREEAIVWYTQAAVQGHGESLLALARLTEEGESTALSTLQELANSDYFQPFFKLQEQSGPLPKEEEMYELIVTTLPEEILENMDGFLWIGRNAYDVAMALSQHNDDLSSSSPTRRWMELSSLLGENRATYQLGVWAEQSEEDGSAASLPYYLRAAAGYNEDAKYKLFALAAQGDPEMQYKVGLSYTNLWSRDDLQDTFSHETSLPRARKWFLRAAEQGHTASMCELARMLEQESHDPNYDDEEALGWYRTAAALGGATAQYRLGCRMRDVRGEEPDWKVVQSWFEKSAALGFLDASCSLGWMAWLGLGQSADKIVAMEHFIVGAQAGHKHSLCALGFAMAVGDDELFLHLHHIAFEWLSSLGIHDSSEAATVLLEAAAATKEEDSYAMRSLREFGYERGESERVAQLRMAAKEGLPEARYCLGLWYLEGTVASHDAEEAMSWLVKAAADNFHPALPLLERLAEEGSLYAQRQLGKLYELPYELRARGEYRSGKQDYAMSRHYLSMAANQGDVEAKYEVANSVLIGSYNGISHQQAISWLQESAEEIHPKSITILLEVLGGNYGDEFKDPVERSRWVLRASELLDSEDIEPYYKEAVDLIRSYLFVPAATSYPLSDEMLRELENAYDDGEVTAYMGWGECMELGEQAHPSLSVDKQKASDVYDCVLQNYQGYEYWLKPKLVSLYEEGFVPSRVSDLQEWLVELAGNEPLWLYWLGNLVEKGVVEPEPGYDAITYYMKAYHAQMSPDSPFDLSTAELNSDVCLGLAQNSGYLRHEDTYVWRIRWYQKAATLGASSASFFLGVLACEPEGQQDFEQARRHFEAAVEGGYGLALMELGLLYRYGRGVDVDYHKAITYFHEAYHSNEFKSYASQQDYHKLLIEIGEMYCLGQGVEPGTEEARFLFQTAAEEGNQDACYLLAMILLDEEHNHKEAYSEAIGWLKKAATLGHNEALAMLEDFGNKGLIVAYRALGEALWEAKQQLHDEEYSEELSAQAIHWFETAAASGDLSSQTFLAECYEYGWFVESDPEQALSLYQEAAERGALKALHWFVDGWERYDVIHMEPEQIHQWHLELAGRILDETADDDYMRTNVNTLGEAYEFGTYGVVDDEQAVKWYELYARRGGNYGSTGITNLRFLAMEANAHAQFALATLLEEGITDKNYEEPMREAVIWYERAAEQGHPQAIERVAQGLPVFPSSDVSGVDAVIVN